jgi:hypothetical protein
LKTAEQKSIDARRQKNEDQSLHELAAKEWKWFEENTGGRVRHYRVENGVKIYHEPLPPAQQGGS